MSTLQIPISVGSGAAVTVVPANTTGSRMALWIQNYGTPEDPSNPTMWVAFGKTAVAGAVGSWQITDGEVYIWGSNAQFGRGLPQMPSVCPQEYISIIAQSGTAVGAILILLRDTSGGINA